MFTSQLTPNSSVDMPKVSPYGALFSCSPMLAPSVSLSQ